MKTLIKILLILCISSCVFSQIQPIEDIKPTDTTPIENIDFDTPEISDSDFDKIPLNTTYASKEEYKKEVEALVEKYDAKQRGKDPFYSENDIYRPPVGERYLISDKLEILKAGISVKGHFEASQDYYYLEGENFKWINQESGTAENILLTTCHNHKRPHLSIFAKKLSFVQKPDKITLMFNNVGIRVFNTNIMWLPVYHLTITKSNYQRFFVIPLITYNSTDGLGLRIHPRLFETDRFYLDPLVRWSFKTNFKYNIYANFAIDKPFGNNPFINDVTMDKSIKLLNDFGRYSPYKNGFGAEDYKNRAHLTATIGTVYKDEETVYSIKEDVDVYKAIDTNITYSFDPFGKMEDLNIYSLITPSVKLSYTREKDEPVVKEYVNKYKFGAIVPYALAQYKGINIQPLVKFDYVNYHHYGTYRIYSAGIDLSKYYSDNSFWNIRYIASKDSGYPILESDTIDQQRGIYVSGQKDINNKYVVGGWFGYNDKKGKTLRSGVMVGIKEDCYWLSFGYDFTKRRVHFSCALLGF